MRMSFHGSSRRDYILTRIRHRRRVTSQGEDAILNRPDEVAMLRARHPFDRLRLLVSHELGPGGALGRFVTPSEQIDELRSRVSLRVPHGDNVESRLPHDPRGMVAEALVECRLVMLKDLVDAQLMDDARHLQLRPCERSLFYSGFPILTDFRLRDGL